MLPFRNGLQSSQYRLMSSCYCHGTPAFAFIYTPKLWETERGKKSLEPNNMMQWSQPTLKMAPQSNHQHPPCIVWVSKGNLVYFSSSFPSRRFTSMGTAKIRLTFCLSIFWIKAITMATSHLMTPSYNPYFGLTFLTFLRWIFFILCHIMEILPNILNW